ncbi:cytochrome c oxidase subunit II [Citreimonas salinaria]|uniref:Cytochrome c oxidase subunit 2 n=1 Tax=Citreimonas salinaria TaxID=321339 RepID=A0A1H3NGA7_9RHOB|nr:c-type cytochrome [Citreimonas salinaria]SDY87219.1 cytochrome c oxidase subunit 2 [Citreimonas salinaria]
MRSRLPIRISGAALVLGVLANCSGSQNVLAPASDDARLIALLTYWLFGVAVIVFFVTIALLLLGLLLSRGGKERPISFRASTALVVTGGVVAPIFAIIALTLSGVMIGDETEGPRGEAGPRIEVVGRLWWWEFRYLDEAGEVVAVTANELHLPVGKRARLELISDNVIHSFWVPNLQGKTDLIPGTHNELYAEPAVPGVWRGQCAEFCGIQHALMGFVVVAEPEPDYQAWLAAEAEDAATTEGPGFDVFMKYGCGDCHTIRGTEAQGEEGPDLTHLASRRTLAAATLPNTRGNLGGWITSTHSVKPGALMPETAPEAAELQLLLDFLESLE